jgi:hypothetical protein
MLADRFLPRLGKSREQQIKLHKKTMNTYDNTNTGALHKNDKAGNEKRPDYKGSINVRGEEFWLSAWIREKRDGSGKFMSLKVEPKEQRQAPAPPPQPERPPANHYPRPEASPEDQADFEDVPF